jgi:hypothetical protein
MGVLAGRVSKSPPLGLWHFERVGGIGMLGMVAKCDDAYNCVCV